MPAAQSDRHPRVRRRRGAVPAAVPPDTVVLLDEAYIEFVAPEHRLDGPTLVRRFPNVVVLRTFSKAYGLAGLRIGYASGRPNSPRRCGRCSCRSG